MFSHQAFYFELEIYRQWSADGSNSMGHGMGDYFEEETVFYARPRRTCVWDRVPGIEIFPLRVKMMCAAVNELSGLVVVVANCRMDTFIGCVIWKQRQLDERLFLLGLHCIFWSIDVTHKIFMYVGFESKVVK